MNYRLKVELDLPEYRQEIAKAILLNVEEVINCASTLILFTTPDDISFSCWKSFWVVGDCIA